MNNNMIERALEVPKLVNFVPEFPITLSSGMISPIYFDWRQSSYDQTLVDLIIDALFQKFRQYPYNHVVGVATGGLRYSSILANKMRLPESYVRTKENSKNHGMYEVQIAGPSVKGKDVILIEDTMTTGDSAMFAVRILASAGVASISLCSIFSYVKPLRLNLTKNLGILMTHKFSVNSLLTLEDFIPVIKEYYPDGEEKAKICEDFLEKYWKFRMEKLTYKKPRLHQ